jgi:outer membrane protein assembly factor BamB
MPQPYMKIVLWAIVILCLISPIIGGEIGTPQDWPHIRGPNYDAISTETGLVESWPDEGPFVLWTRELGQGYSGFVAVAGRLYTQFQSSVHQYVVCLDADTGAEIWRRRVDWPWEPAGAYPGPYATPTWHEGRLYYSTPSGLVGCLEANNGRLLWSQNVLEKFQGSGSEFGYAATPLVENERVFFPVGGPGASIVALDAEDGSTAWATGDDPASYCSIYPITIGRRRLVVGLLQNCLVALDAATGERLFRKQISTGYDEHSTWPLYENPYLFIASAFRAGCQVYQINEDQTGIEAHELWSNRKFSSDVCSGVLIGGHIYGFDVQQGQVSAQRASKGRFKCLDLANGRVTWETDKIGLATILVADGKMLLLNDTGSLILAKVNPTCYEELARAKVLDGGICWTAPALWNSRLFVRNQSRAVCLFLGPPEKLDLNRATVTLNPSRFSFDFSWILTREPEFPLDPPSLDELFQWFLWCAAGVFGLAGIFSAAIGLAARAAHAPRPRLWVVSVFTIVAFLLGLIGTTLYSAWADVLILTWPASLYIAFRLVLSVIVWAEAQPIKLRPRLISQSVILLFMILCYGYYRLCLAVGYVMAWGFLAGFLPASPLSIVAARTRRWWLCALAEAAAFTIYFWTSGMLSAWKEIWFG